MKQQGLAYFSDTYLTSIGLLIFFVFFAGMLVWVHRKNSKDLYSYLEQLPLNEGSEK
jgi:cbb3-type cytochrome oxidase subunit 3